MALACIDEARRQLLAREFNRMLEPDLLTDRITELNQVLTDELQQDLAAADGVMYRGVKVSCHHYAALLVSRDVLTALGMRKPSSVPSESELTTIRADVLIEGKRPVAVAVADDDVDHTPDSIAYQR
jgi:hypothetical protein